MQDITKKQILLQNELTDLSTCYAILRDLYLQNNKVELLNAKSLVVQQMKAVEIELDIVIEHRELNEKIKVVSLKLKNIHKI